MGTMRKQEGGMEWEGEETADPHAGHQGHLFPGKEPGAEGALPWE